MELKQRSLRELADAICGNAEAGGFFQYRTSTQLTNFFADCDTEFFHDGSTRSAWVVSVLQQILNEPHPNAQTPPETFSRVIRVLMDQADAVEEGNTRPAALAKLASILARDGFEPFYGDDKQCYLRHLATNTVAVAAPNPHRPFSPAERERRERLDIYLNNASEDDLIEQVLLPMFRQMGFHRVTAAGHKDKALEYGKDVWMKYTLPTQHIIYFGIQAKKGKVDASGVTKGGQANVAELHNQVLMMLGHEIFDHDIGKRVLVDHAFIVAGGEITKQARNWLGEKLDAAQRSQVMFMDREDILNLYVVNSLPLPKGAQPEKQAAAWDGEIPF